MKSLFPQFAKNGPHADGRRILDVLHVLRALCNDLIVQRSGVVFRDQAFQKIIRCGTGVVLVDAHSAPFKETQ